MGRAPLPRRQISTPAKTPRKRWNGFAMKGLEKTHRRHLRRPPRPAGLRTRHRPEDRLRPVLLLIVMDISNYSRSSGIFFGSSRLGCRFRSPVLLLGYYPTSTLSSTTSPSSGSSTPERVTMPDVDMDFEDTRRAEVIAHCTQEIWSRQRRPISRRSAPSEPRPPCATRDAPSPCRSPTSTDWRRWFRRFRSASEHPADDVRVRQTRVYGGNPDMVAEYEGNPAVKKLIDTAQRIEGISRNASTHAAGIMISDRPPGRIHPADENERRGHRDPVPALVARRVGAAQDGLPGACPT